MENFIVLYALLCVMAGMAKEKERKKTEGHQKAMEAKIDDLIKIQYGLMTPEQYIEKTTRENDPDFKQKNRILNCMKPDKWYRADSWALQGCGWYIAVKRLLDEMAREGRVIKQADQYKKI